VSKTFQEAGAVIVDADIIARQVVMPGQGAYKEIVKVFGEDVINEHDKTINRAKLGAIIFSDPAKRKRLNACTHVSTSLHLIMRS
jgi:dephospho-CoA kinase